MESNQQILKAILEEMKAMRTETKQSLENITICLAGASKRASENDFRFNGLLPLLLGDQNKKEYNEKQGFLAMVEEYLNGINGGIDEIIAGSDDYHGLLKSKK